MRIAVRKATYAVVSAILLLLIVAMPLIYGASEDDAVAAHVTALGGRVRRSPHPVSEWLRSIGWRRPLGAIRTIRLDGCAISDADLQPLGVLDELVELNLERTGITDDGLRHLRPLTRLEVLRISQTRITGQGLSQLHGLTQLSRLDVAGTQITDDDIEHILPLRRIEILNLGQTRVGAEGIRRLAALEELRLLGVEQTLVTLAAFKNLPDFGREGLIDGYGVRRKTTVCLMNVSATPGEVAELQARLPHLIFTGVRPVAPAELIRPAAQGLGE